MLKNMGKCPRYIIKRKVEINKQRPVKDIIEDLQEQLKDKILSNKFKRNISNLFKEKFKKTSGHKSTLEGINIYTIFLHRPRIIKCEFSIT